jgi:hypothetical protein
MGRVRDPALGKHVTVSIRGTNVGEFTDIDQKHKMNTTDYEPLGQQIGKTLDGSKKYIFDLGKGWIDVDLVGLIWGSGGRFRAGDPTNVRPPRFTVSVRTATPDATCVETYYNVLIPEYESSAKGQSDMKTVKLSNCVADGGYDPGVSVPTGN